MFRRIGIEIVWGVGWLCVACFALAVGAVILIGEAIQGIADGFAAIAGLGVEAVKASLGWLRRFRDEALDG